MIYVHCGIRIRFIRSASGKNLPVNEDSLITIVTKDGAVVSGYIAHWQSCRYLQERDARIRTERMNGNGATGTQNVVSAPGVFETTQKPEEPKDIPESHGNPLFS